MGVTPSAPHRQSPQAWPRTGVESGGPDVRQPRRCGHRPRLRCGDDTEHLLLACVSSSPQTRTDVWTELSHALSDDSSGRKETLK